jgi:AcrR family transcriptional regulator
MVEAVNRFRPGSQQRGEDTRRRILETAFKLFASDGFEGASTRTLAERAGVNLPAIQYYFGSKEGLYRAVVEQITDRMEARVAPLAEHIRVELDAGQPPRRQLVAMLCDMLDIVISLMFDENAPDRDSQQKFFARIEVEPNAATDAMQDSMIRHVLRPCTAIIGRLLDRPPDDEQVKLRAMMIIGQAKIFCGWGTSRVLHWDTVSEARVRAVQTVIREHIEAIFRSVRSS